jgi:hypothetical protein
MVFVTLRGILFTDSFTPKKVKDRCFQLRGQKQRPNQVHNNIWVHFVSSAIITKVLPAVNNHCWRQK